MAFLALQFADRRLWDFQVSITVWATSCSEAPYIYTSPIGSVSLESHYAWVFQCPLKIHVQCDCLTSLTLYLALPLGCNWASEVLLRFPHFGAIGCGWQSGLPALCPWPPGGGLSLSSARENPSYSQYRATSVFWMEPWLIRSLIKRALLFMITIFKDLYHFILLLSS